MRLRLLISASMMLAAAVAIPAFAGPPGAHFVGSPTVSVSGNELTVSGKVAGLGNVTQIHVEVTADVQCVNPGSNKPKAANKQSVGAEGDFPAQNGKSLFTLTTTAAFQPECSPPMTLEWSNIVITVTATDVNLSATFEGPFTG